MALGQNPYDKENGLKVILELRKTLRNVSCSDEEQSLKVILSWEYDDYHKQDSFKGCTIYLYWYSFET